MKTSVKKKRTIILGLQFVLMVGTVGGLIAYTNSQKSETDVYVYTKSFTEPNSVITEGDVSIKTIPTNAVTDGFALNKEDIVGKYVDTKVHSGQYVYTNHLVAEGERDVFETLDLAEYRKISLPIDMTNGLSGNIKKGDRLDLVYIGSGSAQESENPYGMSSSGGAFTYSNTFLQNVLVYSVNTSDGYQFKDYSQIEPEELVDENGEKIENSGALGIITLAVTLEQAEEIYSRLALGKVSFVGRFGESQDVESTGYVIGEYDSIFSGPGKVEIKDIDEYKNGKPESEESDGDTTTVEVVTP